MAPPEEKKSDFYAVLGLEKECTAAELRNAYKKLAMKWHPDRCSASRNSKHVEEAKRKFQAIQQAYSVLSDAKKRFLYDVDVYDSDDENDENGMGDFLNEMVSMMSQSKQNESRDATFEELQQLFDDICDRNSEAPVSSSISATPPSQLPPQDSFIETLTFSNKRSSCHTSPNNYNIQSPQIQGFYVGENIKLGRAYEERMQGRNGGGNRRDGRKQKISAGQDVSSGEFSGIST